MLSRIKGCPAFLSALLVLACAQSARGQEAPPPEEAQSPSGPPPAVEQPGPASPAPKAGPERRRDQTEEIVVTGSRIRTKASDRPAPVVTLTSAELTQSGLVSLGDILQRLPSAGGSINSRFNQSGNAGFSPDGAGTSAGSAEIDLRYMTAKRTLVLVDGVRWVPGAAASGVPAASDLNTIPIAMIDRIEVLQDGASTVYGSDAIGGVVNVITKKSLNGVQASAQVGGYQQGDGWQQQYDLVWGNTSERGSTVVGISYARQNVVWAKDRALTKVDVPGVGTCIAGFCSSATPRGRFVFTDPTAGDQDLTLKPGAGGSLADLTYSSANPTAGSFQDFAAADRFDFQPYNMVLTPLQRTGAFTQVDYGLSKDVRFNAKLLFNNRSSSNQAAPEPLFLGSDAGTHTRADQITIDAANNPFGFTLDPSSPAWFIGRRAVEAGARVFDQNVNTWYGSGGFNGTFDVGTRVFNWDATALYSQNRAEQVKHNGINIAKLEKALGPRAACDADPGCRPANIFGGQGSLTPDVLAYIKYEQHDLSDQTLWGAVGNVGGDVVDLPGGPLAIAVGVEHRDLSGAFHPDAIVAAGDTGDVPAQPTSGSYNVSEAYLEALAPIVSGLPGIEALEVTGAVRVSKYSTFGTTSALKAGLRWRVTPDLTLRGSVAQGFRAPGIGELYGSPGRYDANITDPCNHPEDLPAAQAAVCHGLGVPDGYEQNNTQISVTTGGNRDLDPERSLGWVGSVVFSPSFLSGGALDRVDLEVSYYRVRLNDAITTDPNVYLAQCTAGDQSFCTGIERSATGQIVAFNNRLRNIGGITTSGIDWALGVSTSDLGFGRLRLDWLGNYLLAFTEDYPSPSGTVSIKRASRELGDPMRGYPRVKSTGVVSYLGSDFGASWAVRYINGLTETCSAPAGFEKICSDPTNGENQLPATVYNDVQVSWVPTALDKKLSVTLGVNNLFDRDPPTCQSCALNNYDASLYDVPGRFGFVRAGYQL